MSAPLPTVEPRPKLGVVLPLAREASNIQLLLDQILEQLEPHDQIFCVLDRANTGWTSKSSGPVWFKRRDGTRARVAAKAAADPRIALCWASGTRCPVDVYFHGYRAALAAGCQWILEMDAGFSHRPQEIPRFVEAMASGADYAAGSRFLSGSYIDSRPDRYLLSLGGTMLTNALLGTRMHDMTSGFECFSRRALTYVVRHGVQSRAHFFQTEIRYLLRDWKWVEVPISYTSASGRVPWPSIVDALRNLLRISLGGRRVRSRSEQPRSPRPPKKMTGINPTADAPREPEGQRVDNQGSHAPNIGS